jgi:GNAT superfamily N-acetyltransferase
MHSHDRVGILRCDAELPGRARARVEDEWDSVAFNYAAFHGERAVASLRVIDLRALAEPADLLARHVAHSTCDQFGPRSICFASRLAVASELRRTPLLARLLGRAYRDCRPRGIRFAFADCSPELWPFYRRIGFRRFGPDFTDPMFGPKRRLLWVLGDVAHLCEVRSPFLALAESFSCDA